MEIKEYELDFEPIEDIQDADDIPEYDIEGVIVYSRDWTTETILGQIEQGNIDLNPAFQRRNAWNDEKRSKLIESIIKGYPIPEIVLAERLDKKNSYVVIDGKQRLLTLAGFKKPSEYRYWDKSIARNVSIKKDKVQFAYEDLQSMPDVLRAFQNSSLRCTVITNYHTDDVLYDIFYRLNSGSTPLATQELRQALIKGAFSNFLIEKTDNVSSLHMVMNLKESDRRLRDVEVLLRLISFVRFASEYKGNLKAFLDEKMRLINTRWEILEVEIAEVYDKIIVAIDFLKACFCSFDRVGRKFEKTGPEKRFNRAILEVQVYYGVQMIGVTTTEEQRSTFAERFIHLSENDISFRSTIEGTTKKLDFYRIRYSKVKDIFASSFGINLLSPFD